ncbi:MAG: lytic murein transglycosylase [Alphaproteobacteria bacterium]
MRAFLALALGLMVLLGAQGAWAAEKETVTFDMEKWRVWLEEVRTEASAKGIKPSIVDQALTGIDPIPRIIELDRRQPEFTLTFAQYIERVVPDRRVQKGRQMLAQHRALLEKVGNEIGVQPRFIVALWGIETDFGRLTGGFNVVNALATLAFDGRRSAYFRKELFDALQILDEGHIAPEKMTGSWAGAMGQAQFMPSSFVNFAIDYDKDGRRDIWTTQADVFGSAANYLKRVGWQDDQTWGREVRLPAGFDAALAEEKAMKPIGGWQALGVRNLDGSDLPTRQLPAHIVIPDGPEGRAFMVYDNFRATLRWNRSNYFALAVGLLSDRIGGN